MRCLRLWSANRTFGIEIKLSLFTLNLLHEYIEPKFGGRLVIGGDRSEPLGYISLPSMKQHFQKNSFVEFSYGKVSAYPQQKLI